mmetsp:Transcript_113625/g.242582  ORF Transcript_113625/g.242582 Transcript_113625/m.242582 type:complete len:296 (+) Transcript_113625:230-1117(+)
MAGTTWRVEWVAASASTCATPTVHSIGRRSHRRIIVLRREAKSRGRFQAHRRSHQGGVALQRLFLVELQDGLLHHRPELPPRGGKDPALLAHIVHHGADVLGWLLNLVQVDLASRSGILRHKGLDVLSCLDAIAWQMVGDPLTGKVIALARLLQQPVVCGDPLTPASHLLLDPVPLNVARQQVLQALGLPLGTPAHHLSVDIPLAIVLPNLWGGHPLIHLLSVNHVREEVLNLQEAALVLVEYLDEHVDAIALQQILPIHTEPADTIQYFLHRDRPVAVEIHRLPSLLCRARCID